MDGTLLVSVKRRRRRRRKRRRKRSGGREKDREREEASSHLFLPPSLHPPPLIAPPQILRQQIKVIKQRLRDNKRRRAAGAFHHTCSEVTEGHHALAAAEAAPGSHYGEWGLPGCASLRQRNRSLSSGAHSQSHLPHTHANSMFHPSCTLSCIQTLPCACTHTHTHTHTLCMHTHPRTRSARSSDGLCQEASVHSSQHLQAEPRHDGLLLEGERKDKGSGSA